MAEKTEAALEGGAYEIIRARLSTHGKELRARLDALNDARRQVFGSIEASLLQTDRLSTEHNCVARDMVAIGDHCILGYNVQMGLRTETKVADVFSVYQYGGLAFKPVENTLMQDARFEEDFRNLYKYYRATTFLKFARIGPTLYMLFQNGKSAKDFKAFKWVVEPGGTLRYIDNRSEHEVTLPDQHEFRWIRTHRDMHRMGKHPHVSVLDRVFVETVGGDLTIKVEDNTETGLGIYSEPVDHAEQTLDDAEYLYADLGNIIVLKIRPFQEKNFRFIAFNQKVQEARRIDSLEQSCVLLPDDHGIIFANGYYLQTGEFKIYDGDFAGMRFERRIQSPNGEDHLYVFYQEATGTYVLLSYNLIAREVAAPIICHGFCLYENGELCYFISENEPQKHHAIQIWRTPYLGVNFEAPVNKDSFLYKVGNKDIVRAMAECQAVLTLLNKDDRYANLYVDLVKLTGDLLDGYYWLNREEAKRPDEPLRGIRESAAAAIEEFEKVRRIRKHTADESARVSGLAQELVSRIRRTIYRDVNQYVKDLAEIRKVRGEVIGLKELRYVDLELVKQWEDALQSESEKLSTATVQFLLRPDSLKPYEAGVATHREAVGKVAKGTEAKRLEEEIEATAKELELLIEIVSNLKIEDATQTTRIIDAISGIYSQLNQVRAALRQRKKDLLGAEAAAEFQAQLKLVEQGVINYMDVADTVQRCEEYLTKLLVQIEELEGRFAEFDDFVQLLGERREEIYSAFETRKTAIVEARNRRAAGLLKSAERILSGIRNRVSGFESSNEINAYFASDLMIGKVREIVDQLTELEDTVKADDVQSRLKTIREDALRQLKDRKELFVDGSNVIRLGRHAFSVNTQPLDLTVVRRDDGLYFHLTGTNFYETIEDAALNESKDLWEQTLISENAEIYRGEYLAFLLMQDLLKQGGPVAMQQFLKLSAEAQMEQVRNFMGPRYEEGYTKGVHDEDALNLLRSLLTLHLDIGLLRFVPEVRALARVWWESFVPAEKKTLLHNRLKGIGYILQAFPDSEEFGDLIDDLAAELKAFATDSRLFRAENAHSAAEYLFHEITRSDDFILSHQASLVVKQFSEYLKTKKLVSTYEESLQNLSDDAVSRHELVRNWLNAFVRQQKVTEGIDCLEESAAELGSSSKGRVVQAVVRKEVKGLHGDHALIVGRSYQLDYNQFMHKLRRYRDAVAPRFVALHQRKKQLTEEMRAQLRLEAFKPKVLTSFVRNRLIDEVYLPLVGDNLAKQIGAAGESKRTDLMGMLLLISPPGYGKTTLMEYLASRLGLTFVKVNGPAIGHKVTSLDPAEAPNASAREEILKLNLALEMGDNVMIILDDIQHLNAELLQKFISLCDAQRRIEGVYKGKPKTYDLRGKKVCVVMAGNPYTESGEKFQIPDMLANRADTYNLGEIIGKTDDAFKMSYIENCLTSNPTLSVVASRSHKDIHVFLKLAESGDQQGLDFEGNYTPEEVKEIISVLQKLLKVRDIILRVNQEYIRSAAQSNDYRTEPPFKLQGSYRDMAKIAAKVIPIMNEEELQTLIDSHYQNESQTLTTGAEANLLRFREMFGKLTEADHARWEDIKATFRKRQKLMGLDEGDRMTQVISHLGSFAEGLDAIRKALEGKQDS
jgi:hypothetical protein